MDKTKLLSIITAADVSEEVKKELVDIVNAAGEINNDLVKQLQDRLDKHAAETLENIAALQVKDAAEELENTLEKLDDEAGQLNKEIAKKADEIDTEEARKQLA